MIYIRASLDRGERWGESTTEIELILAAVGQHVENAFFLFRGKSVCRICSLLRWACRVAGEMSCVPACAEVMCWDRARVHAASLDISDEMILQSGSIPRVIFFT